MSNLVSDPGFELGLAWTYQGGAARTTVGERTGAWCARIPGQAVGQFGFGMISQPLMLIPGATYAVSIWLDSQSSQGRALVCSIDPGNGTLATLGTDTLQTPGYRLWEVGEFTAVGPTGLFRLGAAAGSPSAAVWFVDDVLVEAVLAVKRAEIKDGFLATLRGITIANGYSMDVRSVEGRKLTPQELGVASPFIRCVWAGEEAKWLGDNGPFPVEMHRKGSICPFAIACYSKVSEEEADELAGHVETILETQVDGQFIGLAYVRDIVVDAIHTPELAAEQRTDYFVRYVRATASYKHTRGQP